MAWPDPEGVYGCNKVLAALRVSTPAVARAADEAFERGGLLGEAVAGLHTMEDEHFGISVVEYMAAGG